MMHPDFPLPDVDWEPARAFWAAAARGVLSVPRCTTCARLVWYPILPCRFCGGAQLEWIAVGGRGRLFSWVVVRHAWIPQVADRLPLLTGLVALEEDRAVRLVTTLVDCAPEGLRCDLPVRVTFRPLRFAGIERTVVAPMFTPDDG